MATSYKVMIVGCGNIAGGYDLLQPENALPLGHAKAFQNHGGFEVVACVDPDENKRAAFQQHWNVPVGFASMQELVAESEKFDIISICTPSDLHYSNITSALALKPRLIFCEKPVTLNIDTAKKAVQACEAMQVLLAVNYSRRWSPQMLQLKEELLNGDWGEVRSVSAVYNKGILNNGSHMVDLLHYLFGPLSISHIGKIVIDFQSSDPTVDAVLNTSRGIPIHLNVANAQDFAMFEMQIITAKGVINMEDGGARLRFRYAHPSTKLPGYKFLNAGEWMDKNGSQDLTYAVSNLFDALNSGSPLASSGSNALQAQYLCEEIKQIALSQATALQQIKEAI